MTNRELIEGITARLEAQERENAVLRRRISELEERLSRYENPKNSRNSSLSPSKAENRPRKNQSHRKARD